MKNAKTEKALSGIEWAIAQSIGYPRQKDEFTSIEFFEMGGGSSRAAAESRLRRMVSNGDLLKRPLCIDGSRYMLYRKA
jgi:hypothetical protein